MPARFTIAGTILGLAAGWALAKPLPERKATVQQGILDELKQVPRPGPFAFQDAALDSVPAVAEKDLARYQADYGSWAELKKRAERMPELTPGAPGWRLAPGKVLRATEARAKSWSREMDQLLDKIGADHPNTPWSLLAQRERLSPRGLTWRPGW